MEMQQNGYEPVAGHSTRLLLRSDGGDGHDYLCSARENSIDILG
jgi:hypothetical protein